VLILNGLGSKGVLRAPFFSRMLVEHVLDGTPIEAEVDVRANG
jgi:glycine/D-amino acid oxidase-like deaminating enzyme